MSGYFAALASQASPRRTSGRSAGAVRSLEQHVELETAPPTATAPAASHSPAPQPPSQAAQPTVQAIAHGDVRREAPRAPIAVQQVPSAPQQVERVVSTEVARAIASPAPESTAAPVHTGAQFTSERAPREQRAEVVAPPPVTERTVVVPTIAEPIAPTSSERATTFTPVVHEDRIEHAVDRAPIAPRADVTPAPSAIAGPSAPQTTVRIGSISLQVHVPPPPAVAPAPAPRPTSIAQPTPAPQTQSQRRFSPQRHYLRWS